MCFPLKTLEVLVWFSGLVLIHLMNSPHVIRELLRLIFVEDMGWQVFAKLTTKKKHDIYVKLLPLTAKLFFQQRARDVSFEEDVITLQQLVLAFESNGFSQLAFYAYGMKAKKCHQLFQCYRIPQTPITHCRWDF